jgi:hypothetical protein
MPLTPYDRAPARLVLTVGLPRPSELPEACRLDQERFPPSVSAESLTRFRGDTDTDPDLPPWAGLAIRPARAPRRGGGAEPPRPPGGAHGPGAPGTGRRPGRAAAARSRRSRRRLVMAAAVLAVAVACTAVILLTRGSTAARNGTGYVTTFQPGELRSVPDACHALGPATIRQLLAGRRPRVTQSLAGSTDSQCTWTVDAPPLFRVLELTSQAYAPSLLASGNGSATRSAIDAFSQARAQLASPPKSAHQPRAQITPLTGLGSAAFSALQVFKVGSGTTSMVTLVVRDRNVLITVTMQGPGQPPAGRLQPVPVPVLRSGALTAARRALAGLPS